MGTSQLAEKRVLTRKEVAERLSVPEGLLRDWAVRRFGPPFMKIGRLVRYPVDELEKWERQQLQKMNLTLI